MPWPEKDLQPAFLKAYARCGRIGKAAKAVGVDRNTPRNWAMADPVFAAQMEDARHDFVESIEGIATKLARGVERGVYFQGVRVATEIEYSEKMIELLLKANAPEKYRERSSVEHSGPNQGPINIQHLTDEDLEHIAASGG